MRCLPRVAREGCHPHKHTSHPLTRSLTCFQLFTNRLIRNDRIMEVEGVDAFALNGITFADSGKGIFLFFVLFCFFLFLFLVIVGGGGLWSDSESRKTNDYV